MFRIAYIFCFLSIFLLIGCHSSNSSEDGSSNRNEPEGYNKDEPELTDCEKFVRSNTVNDSSSGGYSIARRKIWLLTSIQHCDLNSVTNDTARQNFESINTYNRIVSFAFYTDGELLFHTSLYKYRFGRGPDDGKQYLLLYDKESVSSDPTYQFLVMNITDKKMTLFVISDRLLADINPNTPYAVLSTSRLVLELTNTGRAPVDDPGY